jgi:hypothetical protein
LTSTLSKNNVGTDPLKVRAETMISTVQKAAVITATALDINRYICNAHLADAMFCHLNLRSNCVI